MSDEVKVIAHKGSTATFTVPSGTRAQIEVAIAEKLRSETELAWKDDPEGINVACISPNDVWRPRRRFSLSRDEGGEE
jgi:hypothetical protein